MSDAPALLFAGRSFHFPAVTGGQLRTQRLLEGLAAEFPTTVVTFEHHPDSDEGGTTAAEVREALPGVAGVVAVPGLGPAKRLQQLALLPRRRSWTHGRFRSAAYAAALREAARDTGARIVHFDDLATSQHGPVAGALNAVAPQNVEARIAQDTARRSGGLRRAFAHLEARKLLREEPVLWRGVDVVLAASEEEEAMISAAGARRVVVVPNGCDPVEQLPLRAREPQDPLRLVFVGTGTFQPNEHGLAWLVDDVLPRLRDRLPVELDVVGTPPRSARRAPGVRYAGRVAELGPHYAAAHVAVVPVHFGGGSRLKTVEAMAHGRPVVSTRVGAEGLPIEAGRHHLEADDAEGFARHLEDLGRRLEQPDEALRDLVAAARQAAETLFWPRIARGLAHTYRELAPPG